MVSEIFESLDIRVGRIVKAERHGEARKPSYKLWIDFGQLGIKTSSAQLAGLYSRDNLAGRLVVCAVNLGSRNIAGFASEVLVLGAKDANGNVVLLGLERDVRPGERVF
jgi:tRNA-binding protein